MTLCDLAYHIGENWGWWVHPQGWVFPSSQDYYNFNSKPTQNHSKLLPPSKVMYIAKYFFYSSKAHPLPPTPKTPLRQAYRNKDQMWAKNVQIFTLGRIFNFSQNATSNFNHFQEFQLSERHLIRGHRQKTNKPDLGSKRNFSKFQGQRTGDQNASRMPSIQKLWPCVILLITLAKTGADEFIPRDEFTRHPRTTI